MKLADHEIPIGTNRVAAVKQIFLSALVTNKINIKRIFCSCLMSVCVNVSVQESPHHLPADCCQESVLGVSQNCGGL